MAPISITFATADGGASLQSVEPTVTIASIREAIGPLLGIPASEQNFLHNGNPLRPETTFADANISDGDLVLVERAAQAPSSNPASSGPGNPASPGDQILATLANPANREAMDRLRTFNPPLYNAVRAGNASEVGRLYQQMQEQMAAQQGASPSGGPAEPSLDPMSAEGQKAMAEKIRMENVEENFQNAYERNPESFGQVTMLFVDAKINNIPVKAFCDSGAQATILSAATAERCNILRLLDTRFAGVAHGVGTAKILGRIHLALLHIGDAVLETTFTVMEDSTYDMLLGLDMMRRHQACIDLTANVLRIGGATVEFLPEHSIPKSMMKPGGGGGGGGDDQNASTPMADADVPSTSPDAQQEAARPTPAPQSAPAASPAPATTSGQAASVGANGEKISKLVELGFSRSEAAQALQACNGNEEQAAAMLSQTKYGF